MSEKSRGESNLETEVEPEKEKKTIKVVCGYCGKQFGMIEDQVGGISHGICPECFEKEMEKIDKGE